MKLPSSVALPFGTFEEVLQHPVNVEHRQAIQAILQEPGGQQEGSSVRDAVMRLEAPPQLLEQLRAAFDREGQIAYVSLHPAYC